VRIVTHGSGFDTVLGVYTGTRVDALQLVDENDDVATGTPWSEVSFGASAGDEYFIAVDGYRGSIGELVLHWELQAPPENDDFAEPTALVGLNGLEHGTNRGATKEPGEPDHAGQAGDASIWYRWTAPADGEMSIFTAGSTFDTLLAVYTGSRLDALTPLEANDDVAGATWSAVWFKAVQGEVYSVAVDGYGAETGDVVLTWAFEAQPEG
jgi:hypothetical protein